MEKDRMYNVVIIGSGCAGLTAAIYAARANLKPLVLDGHEPGGQLSLTTHVENFPGFPDGIMGPELIENMRKQAQKFGAEFKTGAVSEVDVSKRPFKITAGKDSYETKALILKGRLLTSTSLTAPVLNSAPNFCACLRMFSISSGPMMPSGKPGKFSTCVVRESWPPGSCPSKTRGFRFARAA